MAARRRIDISAGAQAVREWASAQDAADCDGGAPQAAGPSQGQGSLAARSAQRRVTATAVRFSLEELAACAPGHAVEVRVPPFGATQAVAGTVHRRGTPPSVVETDAQTWLRLATGRLGWEEALASGALHASGERCDLSPYLPLMRA
ncbi:MAG: sterol carrier family protein [Actinomyces urogenitalis]|uniref:Bacterial SCP orthologue domain-containing protein n=2 Tax=Actinomyces urogenitalis TaxID=103621 RepID=A0A2I1KR71_9ACTO|nr:sterol carrier family protein [Actinomyces urogenitalis]ETJ03026.1 MAG: Basic proline-rich protein [Actinomyces urogenitalis DORA_12]MDU0864979.1 sterol carrier family protein [Actinomyces urogenitalis]MDU0874142.1 sterol carrier family protein [Actinomyces urogenitalis]MDU0973102.1 sterol carrier family protein [Actinomyces urogenitalis]MDU1563844.1 sterol carrier family protein [Actinomyces urogenitalis]